MTKKQTAFLCRSQADYERLNLQRKTIAPWEDGVRTTGKRGEYEWWYFDSKLSDDSSLVITYYTAPITAAVKGYAPSVSFTLTRPDGTVLKDSKKYDVSQCAFSREGCGVTIGKNTFHGDLHCYQIHFETEKIQADISLKGNTPPWRPETGHIRFGKKDYFAWLPSVPEGSAEASITAGGKTETLTGTGYHDHNWGNTGMFRLMHHLSGGRASRTAHAENRSERRRRRTGKSARSMGADVFRSQRGGLNLIKQGAAFQKPFPCLSM